MKVRTSGKYIPKVVRGGRLILGKNIAILIASGGDGEDSVRHDKFHFKLFAQMRTLAMNEGKVSTYLSHCLEIKRQVLA